MSHSSSYAPPVSRSGFYYSGSEFYVEIDRHRHPRASSYALYDLLTYTPPSGPLLTKAGKVAVRQPAPHKDSPGHFYQAQCWHYGLNEYKTRPAAKKHLLAAFNPTTRTLEVPPHILALEAELKEEYKVANEIAAQKFKEERARQEKARQEEQNKKRGESDAILKEFADIGVVVSRGTIPDSDSEGPSGTKAKKISDAELRKGIAALTEAQLRVILERLVFDKKTPAFKRAAVKELDAINKAEAAKAQAAKGRGKGKADYRKRLSDTVDHLGEYKVIAPYLRDQWESSTQTMKLKMSFSPGRSHLWVWFHFGIVSGVMRSYGTLPTHIGDTVHFQWRGQEEGEGEMTYGEENTASITFLGDCKLRGQMRWMGNFEFVGTKPPGKTNIIWSRSVASWKDIYWGINEASYERANAGRWGGGWYDGGDEDDDASSNSDTVGDPYAEDSDDDEEMDDDEENVAY
ncbi:hypothetical protein FPV67DRAFT_1665160 [Lyophyllum atratum]|nr:hypothetical protein FPV67DRAFT_1665160 [Lyophyllum atratum]